MAAYYNPTTQEKVEWKALCKRLNASIPRNTSPVNDEWYLLKYDELLATPTGTQYVAEGPIVEREGEYFQTYTVEDMQESALNGRTAVAAKDIRRERNSRLTATDFLLMPDYPISTEELAAVKEYRQQLRDIPKQEGFPWPEKFVTQIDWPELTVSANIKAKLSF